MNTVNRNRLQSVTSAVGTITNVFRVNRNRLETMLFPQLKCPVTKLVGTVTMKHVLQQVIRSNDVLVSSSLTQPVNGEPNVPMRPTARF